MPFMTLCGIYSSIFHTWIDFILIQYIEWTYAEPTAASSARDRRGGRGRKEEGGYERY